MGAQLKSISGCYVRAGNGVSFDVKHLGSRICGIAVKPPMTSGSVPQPRALDSVLGTALEPFLRGFQQTPFQADVDAFVAQNAPAFALPCPDGSHPLHWTRLFNEYRALFDLRLEGILANMDVTKDEFTGWVAQFQDASAALEDDFELPGSGGVLVGQFAEFLDALTASESYEAFLRVMYDEVCRLQHDQHGEQLRQEASSSVPQAAAAKTKEIEVAVPEGYSPGQALTVEYLGTSHQLVVPEGCGPGTTFSATVALPEKRTRPKPLALQWK